MQIKINLICRYSDILSCFDEKLNLHHDYLPSIINAGIVAYYCHGALHRDGMPAYISRITNYAEFWKDGQFIGNVALGAEELKRERQIADRLLLKS